MPAMTREALEKRLEDFKSDVLADFDAGKVPTNTPAFLANEKCQQTTLFKTSTPPEDRVEMFHEGVRWFREELRKSHPGGICTGDWRPHTNEVFDEVEKKGTA